VEKKPAPGNHTISALRPTVAPESAIHASPSNILQSLGYRCQSYSNNNINFNKFIIFDWAIIASLAAKSIAWNRAWVDEIKLSIIISLVVVGII